MNNRGTSYITYFVLIIVVVVLALAQSKVDTATITKTINSLNWTEIGKGVHESINREAQNSQTYFVTIILNICDKAIEFLGYTLIEITKLAMELARDNPNIINYKVLLALIFLSLISPLIYPVFIIIVSLILIIKEAYLNRKEKKQLNKMKEKIKHE